MTGALSALQALLHAETRNIGLVLTLKQFLPLWHTTHRHGAIASSYAQCLSKSNGGGGWKAVNDISHGSSCI